VFVADADGSNIRNVTKDSPSTFVPCWSGDGASIAFSVDKLGVVANIFQVALTGGEPRRLTAGPKIDAHPSISPDGSKLAFQSNRDGDYEIYVMNLH
jgi:TolB protein